MSPKQPSSSEGQGSDYGLSTTLANGDWMYFDLKSDLVIFAGPAGTPSLMLIAYTYHIQI